MQDAKGETVEQAEKLLAEIEEEKSSVPKELVDTKIKLGVTKVEVENADGDDSDASHSSFDSSESADEIGSLGKKSSEKKMKQENS